MRFSERTNRRRLREQPARLTTSSTVADASFQLLAQRQSAAVVYYEGHPLGVVTMSDLAGRGGITPTPDAQLGDVMSLECVHLDPAADVDTTLRVYRDAAWHSLRRRRPFAPENVARRARSFDRPFSSRKEAS